MKSKHRIVEVVKPGKSNCYYTQKRVLWIFWAPMHKIIYSFGTDMVRELVNFPTCEDAERAIRETVSEKGKSNITYHYIKI